MSITDELRHYIITHAGSGISLACEKAIANIADRIDVEHEAMLVDARKHVYEGYVELPKDADGKPIRIGDVVIYDHDGVRTGTPETVRWIAMGETEVRISTDRTSYPMPSSLRHYHEPTVEDVLREFAGTLASAENNWGSNVDDAIAKYAKRLTLAKGEQA